MEKKGQNWKKLSFLQGNQEQFFQFCPGRIEAPFLHVLDPNSASFYVKCPRKWQKTYNFDILKHFYKFTPLPLLKFVFNPKSDHILPCVHYLSWIMQSLMFLTCFFSKVIEEKPLGVGLTPPW